jgi:hypothetical protein
MTDEGCMPATVTFNDEDGSTLVYRYDPERTRNSGGMSFVYTIGGSAAAGEFTYLPGVWWSLSKDGKTYDYDASGQIQSYSDGSGVSLNYIYQAGRLFQIYNAATTKSAYFTWGANNRVTAVTDPAGNIWDYKQDKSGDYQAFGNFNYGAAGSAMGIPDQVLVRAAGWAQQRAGTSSAAWNTWSGAAPYGDDPDDQAQIKAGIKYAKECR